MSKFPIESIVSAGAGQRPAKALRTYLTFDGRIEERDAWQSLSAAELFAAAYVLGADPTEADPNTDAGVTMCFRPHGRLYLLPNAEVPRLRNQVTTAMTVAVPQSVLDQFNEIRSREQQQLEIRRQQAIDYFSREGYRAVVERLSYAIDHMAPLIYYIDLHCFSNFYNVGKSGFDLEISIDNALRHVEEHKEASESRQLMFVYCLALLLASGTYTRLEELNSAQINPTVVGAFFGTKLRFYQARFPVLSADAAGFDSLSLPRKAEVLAAIRTQMTEQYRFVRVVNGANLRKKEDVLPLNIWEDDGSNLQKRPEVISVAASAPAGLAAGEHGKLLGRGLIAAETSNFMSDLEHLIDLVVRDVVSMTRSDFGMTRGLRDLASFIDAFQADDHGAVWGWSQEEYFCHVVPGQQMIEAIELPRLRGVLNAISSRMRFNSWHYMPSHFSTKPQNSQRDWFHAPRMADLAEWSDMHHTGHVHASVRYSIRSPAPLRIGDNELAGLIDLRVMRQQGEPYTQADLALTVQYTRLLQRLYQAVVDEYERNGTRFRFRFGGKDWINAAYA
jgi:hypothetical protein